MPFGTLHTLDDLGQINQTVQNYGEEALTARVRQALDLYNRSMNEAISDFAMLTSAYQLPYGVGGSLTMAPLDQFGSPDAQKLTAGGAVGLPLTHWGRAVQWTRHFLLNAPVATIARHIDGMAAGDRQRIQREIMRRILTPTNTVGYQDMLQTTLTYTVHAPLNADGMGIPPGPNGEVFNAGTHTHFLFEAALSAAGLTNLINHIVEHGVTGGVQVYINRAQEAAVRAFPGFDAYVDARIVPSVTVQRAAGALETSNPADRAIGLFNGAEISVKPFVPANYQIAFDRGTGDDKPIAIRTRSGTLAGDAYNGGFGNLYEDDLHPLRATAFGREFGVGTAQRHKVAASFSNGGAYVVPVIP
jgi:hypothetical protein